MTGLQAGAVTDILAEALELGCNAGRLRRATAHPLGRGDTG